jgi:hypothetical protein
MGTTGAVFRWPRENLGISSVKIKKEIRRRGQQRLGRHDTT